MIKLDYYLILLTSSKEKNEETRMYTRTTRIVKINSFYILRKEISNDFVRLIFC